MKVAIVRDRNGNIKDLCRVTTVERPREGVPVPGTFRVREEHTFEKTLNVRADETLDIVDGMDCLKCGVPVPGRELPPRPGGGPPDVEYKCLSCDWVRVYSTPGVVRP